jgi:hypothetical protein
VFWYARCALILSAPTLVPARWAASWIDRPSSVSIENASRCCSGSCAIALSRLGSQGNSPSPCRSGSAISNPAAAEVHDHRPDVVEEGAAGLIVAVLHARHQPRAHAAAFVGDAVQLSAHHSERRPRSLSGRHSTRYRLQDFRRASHIASRVTFRWATRSLHCGTPAPGRGNLGVFERN